LIPLNDVREVGTLAYRAAAEYGAGTALVHKSRRWTFVELSRRVGALAHCIAKQTKPGDRVAIVASNSDFTAIAILATMSARAVAVPVPDIPGAPLRFILDGCAATLVLAETAPNVAASGWAGPICALEPTILSATPKQVEPHAAEPDDIAAILYTSGSTRFPRGVVCPHRQLAFGVDATNRIVGNTCDDVILSARSLSFVYGLHQLFMALASGATLILSGDPPLGIISPKLLVEERVTGLPLVPSAVAALLRSRNLVRFALPSLRYVTSTGEYLAPAHIAALRRAVPGLSVFSMYGLTECGRVAILPPRLLDGHESSVGLPLPGTRVRIVKTDGTPAATHEEGELRVSGPHVSNGYWGDDLLTRERFVIDPVTRERELRTGDLFSTDADGLLYFVNRVDTLIKNHGEWICASEVEAVLTTFPGIAEAAVVGSSSNVAGQVVVAFVVDDGTPIDLRALRRHCAEHLTAAAQPTRFVRSGELLPRTRNGKIDRRLLQRFAAVPSGERESPPVSN
jgi:long-chain acyl-CoA synthetase